jgi:adenosylcobinamide kinase/adenosylcobinamide-phosphate guanylyltransferase
MLTLVIGGARSGKSRFAQSLCPLDNRVVYVATARAEEDEEMRIRIERHRQSRPAHWQTVEEPLALAAAVSGALACARTIVIDCLTVWLANLLWENSGCPPAALESLALSEIENLASMAAAHELIVVSNEVGGGIVPENPVARQFRDLQGFANQRCAALADRVYLTVAGIALPIKPMKEAP